MHFIQLWTTYHKSPKRKRNTGRTEKLTKEKIKLKLFVPSPRYAHMLLPVKRNTTTTTVSSLAIYMVISIS